MTWMEIRAQLAVLHAQARAAGATQQAIADRGGIAGQNTVSRVLSNDKLGPSVEIFVRAIEGLGKSVSEFFAELEQGTAGTLRPAAPPDASVLDRLQRVERALEALGVSLASASFSTLTSSGPGAQAPPDIRAGRPSHDCSSLSPGVINHNHIATIDRQQLEAIVQASTEGILTRLARLDARMEKLGAGDGRVPTKHSTARGAPRPRRAAKHA